MTQIGTVIDEKYEILKEIGKGGMSVVYLAMDKRLNKQWAVKEIRKRGNGKSDEVIVQSLLAEANLMKRLDHPALPRIVDIIDNGHTIYVIMDYIEGESLDKILKDEGAQPQELVIDWAKQLCDALGYLHSQNPPIIYRDMKPANVMLKPEGNLKVIDFGIAREYKQENLADTVSLGTKGYAAPEQFGGHGQTDARTDIYCLGVTLYHLVTGKNPCEPPYEIYPIRQWDTSLSGGLERIIQRCTQLNPEDRYQNCDELMYALEHYEEYDDEYLRKQRRKLRTFVLSASLCFIMAVSGVSLRLYASSVKNNSYDSLIGIAESTSYEEKMESYKKAVSIYPADKRAYLCMLESYEAEGEFGKEENDEFLALYNAYKGKFDQNSADYAELNYKIGMMYFNYYTSADGTYSFSERVQKAYSFFEENNKNAPSDFEYKQVSDCYYQICAFYKQYIFDSASIEEATREDYEKLFQTVDDTLEEVSKLGAYEQLSVYSGVMNLLYDQRMYYANVGMDQEKALKMLKTVYDGSMALSVQKEQSLDIQQDIKEHYNEFVEAVERAYNNVNEREQEDE